MRLASLAFFLAAIPASASAQRTVAHDTLSESTPVAVTCGFCAGEAIGVVFRELPAPLEGIDPADFPLEIRELQIALASARTVGSSPSFTCEGDASGGTALVDLEIWAGRTPPTGDIRTLPLYEPWAPDEALVWAAVEVPLELSAPDVDGSSMYMLRLNRIPIVDESGGPLFVPPSASAPDAGIPRDATYLRVVAHLPAGGSSTLCAGSAMEPPGAVPVRDDDGRIADERNFLYAEGVGFLWNEAAGVNGDWTVRLLIVPSMSLPDGGVPAIDASSPIDAGAQVDARVPIDGGPSEPAPSGGCGCRAAGARPAGAGWIALAVVALLHARRRPARA